MKTLTEYFKLAMLCIGITLFITGCCKDETPEPEPEPTPELEQIPINLLTSHITSGTTGNYYAENGDTIEFRVDELDLELYGKKVTYSDIKVFLDDREIGTYSAVPFKTGPFQLDGISHGRHNFKFITTLSCDGYADTEHEFDTTSDVYIFYERPIVKMKAKEFTYYEYNDAAGNMDRAHTTRELGEDEEEIIITPSYLEFETVSAYISSEIDRDATNFDATIVSQTNKWTGKDVESDVIFVLSDYDWDSKVPVTCSIVSEIEGVHEGIDISMYVFQYFTYVSSNW